MDILAIVQARTGSTRLPNKVLMKLGDKTVLEQVVDRVKKSTSITEVIVATTFHKQDLPIVKLCANNGVRVFCGSEDDVLDRFYQAAKLLQPKHVVRITADCPIIDPNVIDDVINKHLETGADYTANTVNGETYPDGEDVEIFTFRSLEEAWKNARLASEREHVTMYIKNNAASYKIENLSYKEDVSSKRWTLDNAEDYEFLSKIFDDLYPKNSYFSMDDVLSYLKDYPELEAINNHIERNEGLKKSLKEDKMIDEKEI